MAHNKQADKFLGKGYDVFGKYASPQYIKKPIFDLKRAQEYICRISDTEADHYIIDGSNRMEYQKNLAIHVAADASCPMFPISVEAGFGVQKSDLAFEENRFLSVNLRKTLEVSKLQVSVDESEYMLEHARKDLMTKSADRVIREYGGYVVCGVVSGGRWSINVLYNALHHESATMVEQNLKAAATSYGGGELKTELEQSIKKEKAHLNLHRKIIGGDTDFFNFSEISKWQKTVTERTAQVIDFTPQDGLVPIWDFVSDEDRKSKLKEAFHRHAQKQVKLLDLTSDDKFPSVLQTKYVSPPTSCSNCSGLDDTENLALYSMPDGEGWKYVGHSGNDHTVLALRETRVGYGILKKPKNWKRVWSHDTGFFKKTHYTCWIPEAPTGYVALGMFCRFDAKDSKQPSAEEVKNIVVVHESYVEKHTLEDDEIWTCNGSGHTITLGRLRHHALWVTNNTDPTQPIHNKMGYTLKQLPPTEC